MCTLRKDLGMLRGLWKTPYGPQGVPCVQEAEEGFAITLAKHLMISHAPGCQMAYRASLEKGGDGAQRLSDDVYGDVNVKPLES